MSRFNKLEQATCEFSPPIYIYSEMVSHRITKQNKCGYKRGGTNVTEHKVCADRWKLEQCKSKCATSNAEHDVWTRAKNMFFKLYTFKKDIYYVYLFNILLLYFDISYHFNS